MINEKGWSMSENNKNVTINFWGKAVLLTGSNLILLAGAGLTTAMPAINRAFHTVSGVVFWVSMIVTLPALFVVLGGPIVGYLTDKFGRNLILVVSLLLGGSALLLER